MSGELAAALVKAQAAMPAVEPNATNPHFKSKFVSLDHLIAKTRPVLNKHGLAITQNPTHIDGAPALATTLKHDSGEEVTYVMPLLLGGPDMQKLGAALTYARRYAWAAALGIAGEEDDDGHAASTQKESAPEKSAAKTKTAPALTEMAKTEAYVLSLVMEKGGDVTAFKAALETARTDAKTFEAWLIFQRDHWEAQKPPFKIPDSAKEAA